MNSRLLLAYGALALAGVLLVALVWFGTRARRAYSREHRRGRKGRKPSRD
jgi:hypothetical protein